MSLKFPTEKILFKLRRQKAWKQEAAQKQSDSHKFNCRYLYSRKSDDSKSIDRKEDGDKFSNTMSDDGTSVSKISFSRISDIEKLLSKILTAEITVINNCKKINGTSFNSNGKISKSKKSNEKNSDGEKSNDRIFT